MISLFLIIYKYFYIHFNFDSSFRYQSFKRQVSNKKLLIYILTYIYIVKALGVRKGYSQETYKAQIYRYNIYLIKTMQ